MPRPRSSRLTLAVAAVLVAAGLDATPWVLVALGVIGGSLALARWPVGGSSGDGETRGMDSHYHDGGGGDGDGGGGDE